MTHFTRESARDAFFEQPHMCRLQSCHVLSTASWTCRISWSKTERSAQYRRKNHDMSDESDNPDGLRLGRMARLNQWSKTFPNIRLAVLGLLLIYLPGGVFWAIEAAGRPAFEYLKQTPDGMFYWVVILKCMPLVGLLLLIPVLTGMTMIPFAAYRAIRNRLASKHRR